MFCINSFIRVGVIDHTRSWSCLRQIFLPKSYHSRGFEWFPVTFIVLLEVPLLFNVFWNATLFLLNWNSVMNLDNSRGAFKFKRIVEIFLYWISFKLIWLDNQLSAWFGWQVCYFHFFFKTKRFASPEICYLWCCVPKNSRFAFFIPTLVDFSNSIIRNFAIWVNSKK